MASTPSTRRPTAATTASTSSGCTRSGQSARLPTVVVGAGTTSARSSAAHAMNAAPTTVAHAWRSRHPAAHSAVAMNSAATSAPAAPPLATHAKGAPGSRRTASCPAIAPTTAPTKMPKRSCFSTGLRNALARSTGARSTWFTSAGSSASGPPRAPDRSPPAMARAARRPIAAGPCSRKSASSDAVELVVAHETRHEQHHDDADDGGDVDAVHRVEPVDLVDALAAARLAHRAQRLHRRLSRQVVRGGRVSPPGDASDPDPLLPHRSRQGGRGPRSSRTMTRRRAERGRTPRARQRRCRRTRSRPSRSRRSPRCRRRCRPRRVGPGDRPGSRKRPVAGSIVRAQARLCAPGM